MVTLYLAGTSIRLESKIAVGEQIYDKYNKFCNELPEKFMVAHESVIKVRKTRNGYFAYLTAHYQGEDVVAQAANLDDKNEKIIESLASMKTVDEENLSCCVKALKDRGYDLLADWLYGKLAPVLEAQDEEVEKEPELSELETQDEQEKPHDTCDSSIVDLPEFESYLCLMLQKFRTKGMCTNGEIIDYVNEHSQKLKDILCHAWSEEDENRFSSLCWLIDWSNENEPTKNGFKSWLKLLKDKVQSQPKQEK